MITDIARPKTVPEAVRAGSPPGSAFLGGGTWLNSGAADVTRLVSLENLGLDSIRVDGDSCVIGAAATFQLIADDARLPPALRDAVRLTASRTLRNMVTLGGELGLAPADSAVIPVLLALGARVTVAAKKKPIPMQAFGDERSPGLILEVSVPMSGVAAVRAVSRTSHSPRSLVVAGGLSDAEEQPLIVLSDCRGTCVTAVGADEAFAAFSPGPDMHASAAYKRYMAGMLVAELLASLGKKAAG